MATITGTSANDFVFAGPNNDSVFGGAGNDDMYGGSGNGTASGNDFVFGGAGNDRVFGEDDDDLLYGGTGSDTLTGGTGKDNFFFNNPQEGIDTIVDFSSMDDQIVVLGSGFSMGQFSYNISTGALSFGQEQFASLQPGTAFDINSDITYV